MQPLLRASLAVLSIVTCVDASAAVRRNCVTSLEARQGTVASPSVASGPRKPCPVAVGFSKRVPAAREAFIDPAPDRAGRARA